MDISCGKQGTFAAVDQAGHVYTRTGINMDTPHGKGWLRHRAQPVSGNVAVTVGEEGQMFVLSLDTNTAYYVATQG
jgi:hypothetical protein